MGLKKNKTATPPVKEKKAAKEKPTPKEAVTKEKVEPTIEETEPEPIEEKKVNEYANIGITGTHEEISKFKGAVKLQNKKIGKILVGLCKAYNDGLIKID